jgi:NADH-quinone oxidoreductase subunit C/D
MEIKTVELSKFSEEMAQLKNNKHFDFLRNLTGEDWGEEGLGVVYQLENTDTYETINIKVVNPDRENPWIPTVTDLWKAANFYEREVYDFYGIIFIGHPDMRRLYLRTDFKGFPFRKDYDMSPENNQWPTTEEPENDFTQTYQLDEDGKIQRIEKRLFAEDDYVVNIGPQHPATHGVMRYQTCLDGEIIKKINVHAGYIHRGIEKINEGFTYQQTLALTDRLDYLSASMNRHALCMCVEKAMGLEISPRIQYIRTIMDELQRLASHLLFFACTAQDLGALTAFIYGFRDREKVQHVVEETTGGRLIQNYNRIGGVQADIDPNFVKDVKELCADLKTRFKEYEDVFGNNVIFQKRAIGIGVVSKETAVSYGLSGGNGRAAGWSNDIRKHHPYALYDQVDFDEIIYHNGDSYDRYRVRMDEMKQSIRIIEQLIDNIPEGPFMEKVKPIIKVPEGTYYQAVEGSRGEFGVFLESKGDKFPYRLKYRSMGLPVVSAMDEVCRGLKIADLITISATMDYVVPDIDR